MFDNLFASLTGSGSEAVDGRAIQCTTQGCTGTQYRLQDGEILGRTAMAGREVVERRTTCPECGAKRKIKIQRRVSQ